MKAFALNEYETWAAPTLEEAIAAHMATTGCTREEILDGGDGYEYSEKELSEILVYDSEFREEGGGPLQIGTGLTFLNRHIAQGKPAGFLFGSEF